MKDLCQKWKLKLLFLRRLSEIGIVQCLEIIDVGCNLKQFDGLIRLTPTTSYFTTYYATGNSELNKVHSSIQNRKILIS